MTSGRYDGREWPLYQEVFDVPEWEAEYLVKGGTAEYPDKPELDRGFDVLRVPDPDYESGLKLADGGVIEREDNGSDEVPSSLADHVSVSDDFDSDFEDVDDDNEVERPSTADKKDLWIEYAVSKGADRETASAKTKAMLIADY